MNRWITACLAAALMSATVVGCESNGYDPHASTDKLASVAARTKFPSDLTPVTAENVFYSIGDNGVITLNNAGSDSIAHFELWVNKAYYLEVNEKLPAHQSMTYAPEHFYNMNGTSLKSEAVSQNWTVQMVVDGRLLAPKGPVKM